MGVVWAETLTSAGFAAACAADPVAILPVAAIEPHGPHLPLSTDCDIARGHLAALSGFVPDGVEALILPLQTIGASDEHQGLPGVFSHRAEALLGIWDDVVRPFRLAGGRRLAVMSSHGGNSETVALFVQRLRATHGLLAVTGSWLRFGQPEGLFAADELAFGIHGGAVETALMLHYRPDLVDMAKAANFASRAADWAHAFTHLGVHGRTRLGWLSRDLNDMGVVGDATLATAGMGAKSAAHALKGMGELLAEMASFDLAQLGGKS